MKVDVHDFTYNSEKSSFLPIVLTLVMEKKAFICCFPVDACSYLAWLPILIHEFHSDERRFVIDCYFVKLINLKGVLYSALQEKL